MRHLYADFRIDFLGSVDFPCVALYLWIKFAFEWFNIMSDLPVECCYVLHVEELKWVTSKYFAKLKKEFTFWHVCRNQKPWLTIAEESQYVFRQCIGKLQKWRRLLEQKTKIEHELMANTGTESDCTKRSARNLSAEESATKVLRVGGFHNQTLTPLHGQLSLAGQFLQCIQSENNPLNIAVGYSMFAITFGKVQSNVLKWQGGMLTRWHVDEAEYQIIGNDMSKLY